MSNNLSGLSSLGYQGTNAVNPPNIYNLRRDPTTQDWQNFSIGDIWINRTTLDIFMLVSLASNQGDWQRFASSGDITSITGDSGGPVSGDSDNNVDLLGGANITTVGNPGTSTMQVSVSGTTNHAVQVGNSAGSLTSLAVGTNGQLLLGGTAANPSWRTPTAGTGLSVTTNSTTLQYAAAATVPLQFNGDSGSAVPAANAVTIWSNRAANNSGASVSFSGATDKLVLNVSDASNNTFIGKGSANLTLSGTHNTALGVNSATALTTGTDNICIGYQAGNALTTNTYNTIIGHAGIAAKSQLVILSDGLGSPVLHNYPGSDASTSNGGNVFVGGGAGNFTLAGGAGNASNNAVGAGALQSLTTGARNDVSGTYALTKVTSGSSNVAMGHAAGFNSGANTGLTTGSFNTFLGYNSGNAATSSESSNICINGPGVLGESNVLRIGLSTGAGNQQLSKSFIHGIRGVTTTVNDAIAVLIDSAGQLGTVSSSERFKEEIRDLTSESEKIYSLRPVTFKYKNDVSKSPQWGLIAEEVIKEVPGLTVSDSQGIPFSVKYHELPILLLNELKKLQKRVEELEQKL